MPIPVLINELFDICSSALHKLGKTKPGSEHSSSLMVQRKARLWGANISLFKIQYSEVKYGVSAEELMKRGGHGQLYAGMFRILAESIFHACK